MKFEDINLLIISALYSKPMALFKTQAEQSSTGAQAGKLRLREKAQLTEEAFSDELTNFLWIGDYQGAWNSGQDSNYE